MRKIYTFLLAIAALCVSSCTQEVPTMDVQSADTPLSFYVDFDQETRISFGADKCYHWEGDERLGVYVASAAPTVNCPTTVAVEESRGKCWTTTKHYVTGDRMYVYYPWNEHNDMQGAGSVSLVLPTAQKQTKAGNFSVENMPMVAQPLTLNVSVSTPTIYMRPLAGFLCVNLYASDKYAGEKVTSVGFADADTPLAGTFTVDMTQVGADVPLGVCDKNSVAVSVAEPYAVGTTLASAKSLYLVLAAGEYEGTLTVTTNKAIYTYNYSRKVARNTYYDVNIDLSKATARRSIEAEWGGGDGSVNNPYIIAKPADLTLLATRCNTADTNPTYAAKSYRQVCDIDMSGVTFSPIGVTDPLAFLGSYDGGGYTISNLNVKPSTTTSPCALFGYVADATISNLTIKDMTNNSTAERAAGFVGSAFNVTITNCELDGKLTIRNLYCGGFVGHMEGGRIANCEVKGVVENPVQGISWNGESNAAVTGGFAGCALGGAVIEDCVLSGDVSTMGRYAGGIVARLEESTVRRCRVKNTAEISNVSHYCGGVASIMLGNESLISDCRFEGRVNSSYPYHGGIVGSVTAGKVYNCIATSTSVVAGAEGNAGGIAGQIQTTSATDIALIDNCSSYGHVEDAFNIGGIVGYVAHNANGAYAGVTNCAAIGNVLISKGAYKNKYNLVGGIVGWITKNYGTSVVANCVGRPKEMHGAPISGTAATKQLISGLVACADNSNGPTIYGCYTDITRSKILVGFEPVAEITSGTVLHGAIFGYSYRDVSTISCFYDNSIVNHGTVGSGYTCTETDCAALTPAQMTDGTLLSRLNAAATAYTPAANTPAAKQWVAGADGYPIPSGLLADTTPLSAEPKKVSVIGDSISTFRGYIPYGYSTYYPRADGSFLKVEDMYWHRLIYNYMTNARLERNISYSGSLVTNCNDDRVNSSQTYYAKRFILQNGVGDADIVIIHGGTNDTTKKVDLATGILCTSETGPSESVIASYLATADKAKTRAEIEALNDETYCEAYIKLVRLVQERNPQVKIVCVIGDHVRGGIQASVHAIAKHYGAKVVDLYALRGYGNTVDIPKVASSHPTPEGMEFIANKTYVELGTWLEE